MKFHPSHSSHEHLYKKSAVMKSERKFSFTTKVNFPSLQNGLPTKLKNRIKKILETQVNTAEEFAHEMRKRLPSKMASLSSSLRLKERGASFGFVFFFSFLFFSPSAETPIKIKWRHSLSHLSQRARSFLWIFFFFWRSSFFPCLWPTWETSVSNQV